MPNRTWTEEEKAAAREQREAENAVGRARLFALQREQIERKINALERRGALKGASRKARDDRNEAWRQLFALVAKAGNEELIDALIQFDRLDDADQELARELGEVEQLVADMGGSSLEEDIEDLRAALK